MLKNEFETALVNEPSVFETLSFTVDTFLRKDHNHEIILPKAPKAELRYKQDTTTQLQ